MSPEQLADSLTEAQRDRLLKWPDGYVVFDHRFGHRPDAVATQLCDLGLCTIMPFKHGSQLGMLPLGLKVSRILEDRTCQN